MAMQDWAEDACDEIDAGFFSGDSFHDADALERIEWYMTRWQREIVNIRKIMAEVESHVKP